MTRRHRESFEKLDRLLEDLPEHRASPGFTNRVLNRVESDLEINTGTFRFGYGLFFPAIAVLGLGFLLLFWFVKSPSHRVVETGSGGRDALQQLMKQTQALQNELADLRGQVREGARAVSLGKSGDIEYLIDLESLASMKLQPPARSL